MKRNTKKIFISIVLIMLILFSYGLYHVYLSPLYSLYQIKNSIINKDKSKFLQYVDVDSVIDNFIEQILKKQKELLKSSKSLESIKIYLSIQFIESFKEEIKKIIKSIIFHYFDSSKISNSEIIEKIKQYLSINYINIWDFFLNIKVYSSIQKIEYTEDFAIVFLKYHLNSQKIVLLQFKFQKYNSIWKLIEISNLYEIIINNN